MPFRRAPPTPTTQTGSTAASSSSVHRRLGNRSFNESDRAQDNSSSSSYQAPKAVASSSSSSSPSSLRVTSARNLSASASGAAAGAQLWGIGHKDFIVFEEAGVKLGKVLKVVVPAPDDELQFGHILVGVLEPEGEVEVEEEEEEGDGVRPSSCFRLTGEHSALAFSECIYGMVTPLVYDSRRNCYRSEVPLKISASSPAIIRRPLKTNEAPLASRPAVIPAAAASAAAVISAPLIISSRISGNNKGRKDVKANMGNRSGRFLLGGPSSPNSVASAYHSPPPTAASLYGGEEDGGEREGQGQDDDEAAGDAGRELAAWDMPRMAKRTASQAAAAVACRTPSPRGSSRSITGGASISPVRQLEHLDDDDEDDDEEMCGEGDGASSSKAAPDAISWKKMKSCSFEGVETDHNDNYRAFVKIYKYKISGSAGGSTPSKSSVLCVHRERAPGLFASALEAAFARDAHAARFLMKQSRSDASTRLCADFNFRL